MYNLPNGIKSRILEYLIDEPKIQRLKNNSTFKNYINSRLHKYRIDVEKHVTSFNIWNVKSYDKKAFRYIRFIEDEIKDKLNLGYVVYLDIYVGVSFFYIPNNENVNIFVKSATNFEIKNWDDFVKEYLNTIINSESNMPDVSNVHFTDITFKYFFQNMILLNIIYILVLKDFLEIDHIIKNNIIN